MNNNIFIAFDNKKTAARIAKILISNGNNVVIIAKSFSELDHAFSYYRGGLIITGCSFDGISMERDNLEITEDFTLIVIGSTARLDTFPGEGVFKLALPLEKNDLICSVEMLITMDTQYKPTANKNNSEQRIIQRAKNLLIDRYSMTEAQAHRYMQKKSMDTGRKMSEIAEIILNV